MLAGSLLPIAAILLWGSQGQLGANPIEQALNQLGLLALIFLVASLAATPAKWLTGWTWPIRIRRMLGVIAFVYAALHVGTYAVLDQGLAWSAVVEDVFKRKFIFVGFAAFVLLIPLAATSTNAAVKKMGFVAWKRVHRLAYVAGVLGIVHFVWRVKRDWSEPAVYGTLLAALLVARVVADFVARRENG